MMMMKKEKVTQNWDGDRGGGAAGHVGRRAGDILIHQHDDDDDDDDYDILIHQHDDDDDDDYDILIHQHDDDHRGLE